MTVSDGFMALLLDGCSRYVTNHPTIKQFNNRKHV